MSGTSVPNCTHRGCTLPATTSFLFGCVHEHVGTEYACGEHCHLLMPGHYSSPWQCSDCKNSPRPHICPVTLTELPV